MTAFIYYFAIQVVQIKTKLNNNNENIFDYD